MVLEWLRVANQRL